MQIRPCGDGGSGVSFMLPSFRLIAATFLCGFFVVFAGLRLAASLNDMHEGLPVMGAHAAPVSIAPLADREMRRGLSVVPMMYDLRFAVSTVSPTLVRVAPTVFDRPAPLGQPMTILPPEDIATEAFLPDARDAEPAQEGAQETGQEAGQETVEQQRQEAAQEAIHEAAQQPSQEAVQEAAQQAAQPEAAVAAIQPEAPLMRTPVISPDEAAEIPAPAAQAAAIEPQIAALPEPSGEPLIADEPDTAVAVEAPAAPGDAPASPAVIATPIPPAVIATPNPPAAIATRNPRAATSVPRVKAKAAVTRKKPVRTARA